MRAILLARVSTEEQDEKSQMKRIVEYAESRFEVKNEDIFAFDESAYADFGKRKKFKEVLNTVRKSKERVAIVCDKIDRISRDFINFLPIVEELRITGRAVFHFPSDNIVIDDESPANDLFRFNMGLVLAQYYSDAISDNVKRKIEYKVSRGQILSKAPYGYRNIRIDDHNGSVKVHPFESEVVKKIFEWYVSEAYSMREIIDKLRSDFNIKMAKSSIGRILENKFYIGIATYKKKNLDYPHVYHSIIAEDTFWKVQEIKSGRTQWDGKGKYAGKKFHYRNLLKCAACGYSMSPEQQRGKNYYCCTEYGGKHGAQYVNEDVLTDQFTEIFAGFALTEDVAKRIFDDLVKLGDTSNVASTELVKGLRSQFDNLKATRKGLIRMRASGSITNAEYLEEVKSVDDELAQLTEKMARIETVDKDFYLTAGLIIELARNSAELFMRSEDEEKRELIKTVLSNVTWNGEKLSYTYNKPFDTLRKVADSPIWGG